MDQFKPNKYSNYYQHIIDSALAKQRSKKDGCYYERHHILPRSLGGNNSKTNLVYLTAREHFVVHLLLVRMVQDTDVYRMVNAVRRFTKKVSNSREYELLRTTISKYSKGHLNPAHGKIWIHNINTNDILYIQKEEFLTLDQTTFKKGLPYQRGGHRDTIWVNNSQEEAIIKKDDLLGYLNKGWVLGRLTPVSLEHMKQMAKQRHTAEKDQEHSQKLSGRIAIRHTESGKIKKIHPSQLSTYTSLGYTDKVEVTTSISRPVLILGKKYVSVASAAKELNIVVQTLAYRLVSNSDKWKEWQYL